MSPVPVFMYHHVSPHKGDMVTVAPDVFEAQMRFLADAGYKTLSADEVLDYILGTSEIHEKAVAVTFDDGYLDNYIYAFPVFKKYNIKATIFIVTDWVEAASLNTVRSQGPAPAGFKQGSEVRSDEIIVPSHTEGKSFVASSQAHKVIMNWDMIKDMQKSGLAGFYSHTMSHKKCAELSDEKLMMELKDSKRVMEQRLHKPCPYLCWPKGSFNESAVKIAREAGYEAVFTTQKGVIRTGSNRYCIERIGGKDSAGWFKNKVRIYTNPLLSSIYLAIRGKE